MTTSGDHGRVFRELSWLADGWFKPECDEP